MSNDSIISLITYEAELLLGFLFKLHHGDGYIVAYQDPLCFAGPYGSKTDNYAGPDGSENDNRIGPDCYDTGSYASTHKKVW